jgi:hypothetical protein
MKQAYYSGMCMKGAPHDISGRWEQQAEIKSVK